MHACRARRKALPRPACRYSERRVLGVLAMASSALALGTVLLGEIALEEQLGRSVYRARRTRDGRELSLRIVRPRSSQEAADFLTLAATASRVRHPALASVEAYGRLDADSCYIASELVTGQRLDEWADAVGIPPLVQVVELVRRLCVGLQAAARAGVVHDAINPRNVFVQSASGSRVPAKILGLGVPALLFDYAQEPHSLRFMSPEQLQVVSRSELPMTFRCSAQMNVYSCGALLYYLATGGPPFPGASATELLSSQVGAPLVPPARINPQITVGLSAVILRALSLDPGDRFASVADLGEALASVSGSIMPVMRRHESSSVRPTEDLFGPEPPTSRTSLPEVEGLARRSERRSARAFEPAAASEPSDEQSDKPTLPPAPPAAAIVAIETRDSISGVAPIGLFSSSPPTFEGVTLGVSEVTNASASKPTPLAAFSEPPRPHPAESTGASRSVASPPPPSSQRSSTPSSSPAPARRSVPAPAPSATRVSTPPPRPTRISRPPQARVSDPGSAPPRRRPLAWPWVALPLAALVCLLAFFFVRSMLDANEQPQASAAELPVPTPISRPDPTPAPQPAAAPRSLQGAVVAPAHNAPDPTTATVAEVDDDRDPEEEEEEEDEAESEREGRRRQRAGGSRKSRGATSSTRHTRPASEVASPPQSPPQGQASNNEPKTPASLVDEQLEDKSGVVPGLVSPSLALKIDRQLTAPGPALETFVPATRKPKPASNAPVDEAPLTAKVRIETVDVRGSLPTSQVRHAVDRLRSQFKVCYEQAAQAAGHNGFGELIVDIEIDERGRARSPRVRGARLPRLEACVIEAAHHLITRRAPDTGTVSATWKIAFSP